MTARRKFVESILGFVELREARALSWGFYDVSFGVNDLEELLREEASEELQAQWANLEAGGESLESLVSDLAYSRLLHDAGDGQFRTRFAESVRLLSRLRQMFRFEDWSAGPTLVSDLKIHLAPRRYPRRNVSVEDAWSRLSAFAPVTDVQRDVFLALAKDTGGGLVRFSGFQVRGFERILRAYGERSLGGTVISAGTSAGKTKAFYVPAFLGIARDLAEDASPFTKVIAIYPRNVLLADQLREALSEASKMASVCRARGLRHITFGALLGATPWEWGFRKGADGKAPVEGKTGGGWRRLKDGHVVPFLKSPADPNQDLVWRDADREAGRTCLYEVGGEKEVVPDGVIRLTREQLQRSPPDVLFLSLEMLNREMGTPDWWRCFGIDVPRQRAPRMLLLDEVHSYAGIPGVRRPGY